MNDTQCLLCGDPQQPSEYMRQGVSVLEGYQMEFEQMDWRGDLSAAEFRDVTMDMEERGPNAYDSSDIAANLDGVNVLLVHKAPVSRAVFEAGDDLEIVAAARGGTENVDTEAAEDHGVTVLHAPGRNAAAVSDYAVTFALSAHRSIPDFTATTARGEWALEFDPANLPVDVESLNVGIVGFGNIGRKVAERYAGFDPDIFAYDPYVENEVVREYNAEPVELDELLTVSDIVTLHVRLSPETERLIDADAFESMSEDALLVNTARGGLVDEDALVDALRNDTIGGAALDVFREEPLPDDHPLIDFESVLLSPHTAGSTRDAVLNGSRIVATDIASLLDGDEPAHRLV